MLSPSSTLLLLAGLASSVSGANVQAPLIADHLGIPPHPNATANLVFNTVRLTLRAILPTETYAGQNIVPAVIPKGTLLYHARNDDEIPLSAEWTALDPEFSHLYCRGAPRPCWLLTLVTTGPLQVLYFDGSSATKSSEINGTLDTQDLLSWGAVLPGREDEEWEYPRLQALCEWG
uniref:Uncharacterized protein n=1 Tax=Mycena chlorophos TaxID=658473 RepID=A0ABQ0L8K9_MYCCL|nr:predicted protein [Mycena chlorophos]